MSAVKSIFCLLLGMIFCFGCNDQQRNTPPATDDSATGVTAQTTDASSDAADIVSPDAKPTEVEGDSEPNADVAGQSKDSEGKIANQTSTTNAALVSTTVEADSQTLAPPKPRRVIFLGSRAPVLVDLFVMQGDRAVDDVALESAREMIESADKDEDGSTVWEEIAGYSGMSDGGGNMRGGLPRGRQRGMLFRSYDTNANGKVDEAELIRFYNRGQASLDWLVMRTTLNVAATEIAAPLGRWLDANRNGKLESYEIDAADVRLMMKDGNDDGVLQKSEFQESGQAMQLVFNPQQAIPESAMPAFFVTDDAEWSELLYRLQRKYTFGAPLLSEDTELWTEAFQDLDEDGDGTIWDHELAAVANRPADLDVAFRFPSLDDYRQAYIDRKAHHDQQDQSDSGDAPIAGNVTVTRARGEDEQRGTAVPTETSAGTMIFAVANSYLDGPYAEQLELGFDRLDADDDDALSESEFVFLAQALQLSFESIDADNDDKVTREELDQGLSPATQLATMRVELWMLPQDDPIFTALDQDHNGQLEAVEIAKSADRLLELDADQDGIVQSSETDFGMFIVLRNAPPGNVFPPPSPAQITRTADSERDLPAWFRATDANRDGTISRREFLGEMELFDRLDADHNGALSVTEATSG
jgi:Ca2+-binding EF-hand superfamily protein